MMHSEKGQGNGNLYRTRDLALAAYLKVRGMILQSVEDENRGNGIQRKIFVFQEGKMCRQIIFEYQASDCAKFESERRALSKIAFHDK